MSFDDGLRRMTNRRVFHSCFGELLGDPVVIVYHHSVPDNVNMDLFYGGKDSYCVFPELYVASYSARRIKIALNNDIRSDASRSVPPMLIASMQSARLTPRWVIHNLDALNHERLEHQVPDSASSQLWWACGDDGWMPNV